MRRTVIHRLIIIIALSLLSLFAATRLLSGTASGGARGYFTSHLRGNDRTDQRYHHVPAGSAHEAPDSRDKDASPNKEEMGLGGNVEYLGQEEGNTKATLNQTKPVSRVAALIHASQRRKYLPNFYLDGKPAGRRLEYNRSHLVFIHIPKSGGSSLKYAMNKMSVHEKIPFVTVTKVDKDRKGVLNMSHFLKTREKRSSKANIIAGSCLFGVCDVLHPLPCSYFIMGRDPIDRIVSLFLYCQQESQQDCIGPKQNMTVNEWAMIIGPRMFHLLLGPYEDCSLTVRSQAAPYPSYSQEYGRVRERLRKDFPYLPSGVRWEEKLKKEERQELLQYILDNLETWFAVIGLTEEFDLSRKMLEHVYGMPISKYYTGPANTGTKRAKMGATVIEDMKSQLRTDPLVMEALYEDLIIYGRMREIMMKQKMSFLRNYMS